ncbi:MAG: hypothetical protein ACLQU2_00670 [Candidatus Binataceae bacterium]
MNHKHRLPSTSGSAELLQSDLSTGDDLIRAAQWLVRNLAAGAIDRQQYDALLRGIEVIAALRRQFPAGAPAAESNKDADDAPAQAPKAGHQAAHSPASPGRVRPASERRRQTLEFVSAFAHDVAAATPVASSPASTRRLRSTRRTAD